MATTGEAAMEKALLDRLREFAHRRGWIASPSLAFMGVPFGPGRRDLAGEVMADLERRHDEGHCPVCFPDAARWTP